MRIINIMKKVLLFLCALVLFAGCSTSYELEYLRQINGAGAAEYFGPWVSILKDYLIWPYIVIPFILFLRQGFFTIIGHIGLATMFLVSFQFDYDPMRAFLLPYFVGMTLLFIPSIKKDAIITIMVLGTTASLLFLCYKAWAYEGFFSWLVDITVWGFCAYIGFIAFIFMTYRRCPHCGHFALSKRGRTKRYDDAIEHFRYLDVDGSDIKDLADDGQVIEKEVRCAHCFEPSLSVN